MMHTLLQRSVPNLTKYGCVAFDMDYTLASYKHDELPSLVYNSALEIAVEMDHLPSSTPLLNPLGLRRGVVLDGHTGNICVLDPLMRVVQFSHAFGAPQDARALYGETEVQMDGQQPGGDRWWVMGTHFELPFQQLFQHATSHIDQREQDERKRADCYAVMLKSFKEIINTLFGNPESVFFNGVRADPQRYIHSSAQLVPHLQHLRQSGTRVAVVSNSMPFYVHIVMQAAFGDDWGSLFDLVVARSLKPGFFVAGSPSRSFLHPETQAPLSLSGCGLHMVFGGNDVELLDFINSKGTDGISQRPALFVGDSITQDVIAPSRTGRWQAAAIVEEVLALQEQPCCHPFVLPPEGFPSMFGEGHELSWWGQKLQQHAVCVRASALELLQQGSGLAPPS